jgi:hypothetical protein
MDLDTRIHPLRKEAFTRRKLMTKDKDSVEMFVGAICLILIFVILNLL